MNPNLRHSYCAPLWRALCAASALTAWAADGPAPGGTNAPATTHAPASGAASDASTNAAPAAPAASSTNTPANTLASVAPAAPGAGDPPDFSSFKVIGERNIFNPNRVAAVSEGRRPRSRPPAADAFTLAGVMLLDKGDIAFFNGAGDEYRKALKVNGKIAGMTVAGIALHSVKLAGPTNEVELRIGTGMRRENGVWIAAAADAAAAAAAAPEADAGSKDEPAGAAPSSGGGPSEVLKRLMERRKQQIKP